MEITINLTESEIKKLEELTDMEINRDDFDDDVSYAISVLIENS